jgi:RNA polymerase sigma factor (sigma-70 family)
LSVPQLAEDFFRREYAKLVATLSRQFGFQHLQDVEDAAQSALMSALQTWTTAGLPDNPTAWLFRVAINNVLGEIRRRNGRQNILASNTEDILPCRETGPKTHGDGAFRDDLLRLLFVCCDEMVPEESQLALALKTLCGFDTREIALRLFTTEASVYKRLGRAREKLQTRRAMPTDFSDESFSRRLPTVHSILYLLFTEGHLSTNAEMALRRELCDEAIRLASLLATHPVGQTTETFALLALMHLHRARMAAREDASGGLILLEEQDRRLWDQEQIREGMEWLTRSAHGDKLTRYHAEAAIAAEHCLSPSFAETRWDRVVECYELLEAYSPSAIHRLNRAIAVAERSGPAAGLAVLNDSEPPGWLSGSYLWAAVLADLHRRCGHGEIAQQHHKTACKLAPSSFVARALERRLSLGR